MITPNQILMGRATPEQVGPFVWSNLLVTASRVSRFINLAQIPWDKIKLNDGYRRTSDTPKNGALKSKHLMGQAVDLDDDDTEWLWKAIQPNLVLAKDIGIWFEHPAWTHGKVGTWMHCQTVPPKSGRRIFIPSVQPAPAPWLLNIKYDKALDGF
jgi:hypothetical protein